MLWCSLPVTSTLLKGATYIASRHHSEVLFYNISLRIPPEGCPLTSRTPARISPTKIPPLTITNTRIPRNPSLHYSPPLRYLRPNFATSLGKSNLPARELWKYPAGDITIKNSLGAPPHRCI